MIIASLSATYIVGRTCQGQNLGRVASPSWLSTWLLSMSPSPTLPLCRPKQDNTQDSVSNIGCNEGQIVHDDRTFGCAEGTEAAYLSAIL